MGNNTEEEEEEIEKAQSVSPKEHDMILFRLSSLLLTQGSEPGQMMMMMYPCNSLSSSSSPPNFAPITSLVKVQINFY